MRVIMKNYFYKYKDTYILSGILATVFILYWLNVINDKESLGIFVSVGTIYFSLMKYRIENDRVFKDLFDSFNKRYTSEFNNLFMEVRDGNKQELNTKDKNIIIDYFNLSAEEFLWYERGRIPNKVWRSWRSGILENLKLKQIREIYNLEMETEDGKKSYYGLEKELKSYLTKE